MPTRSADFIGNDPRFLEALAAAEKAAKQDISILIYGETGSGKGRVAELIHEASGRAGRFLSINCAAFQPNLFESELFGYMKGAFTGAEKDTPGLFETAQGGTLFLDEIADTPREVQPKLLRAVEQGVIRRVGGREEIPVDVRLVSATNKDLKELIRTNQFREDLYYRINTFELTLPPLRERTEDIPALARHFLGELVTVQHPPRIADSAMRLLRAHEWPGNVRELRSAVQHACAQAADAAEIVPEHLPPSVTDPAQSGVAPDHRRLFRELDDHGGADPVLWARFLLALARHNADDRFSRGDVLDCLRECRGDDVKEHALAYEWLHRIKPTGIKLGLIAEEGKKVVINRDACESQLEHTTTATAVPPMRRYDAPSAAVADRRNTNVPGARTSFVGRGDELAMLCKVLRKGQQNLVTVTGPGGMGKTRIAREAARALADKLPGGAWFVDLVEARDADGIAAAVAQTLRMPLSSDQPPEEFVAGILELRKPMVLVLDNFEQVVQAAPETVGKWAERAPQVRFLVTSRARLGLHGELGVGLEPLSLPQAAESSGTVARNDAVRLFVERAQLQNRSFTLSAENSRAVAAICERLEGIPLAIELAAARVAVLKPEEILAWLDKLLPVLETERIDVTPRHRSLEVAIDWSFNLLSEADKAAFMRLSVFRGGFYIDAAAAVLDGDDGADAHLQTLNLIQRLCGNSLLRVQDTPYGNRFSMYVAIHEYARQCLLHHADPAEIDALRERHARYYRAYVEDWNREGYGPQAVEALDRLDFERANVQSAMDWAVPADGDPGSLPPDRRRLFVQLAGYQTPTLIFMRGPVAGHIPTLRRAMTLLEPDWHQSRISLRATLGVAEKIVGMRDESIAVLDGAIADAKEHGYEHVLAIACNHQGDNFANEPDRALDLMRRALKLFERHDETKSAHSCRISIARVLAERGHYDQALEELALLERLVVDTGDLFSLCHLYVVRAMAHCHAGNVSRASSDLAEAENLSTELQHQRHLAWVFLFRSTVLRLQRRLDEARNCLELAAEHSFDNGDLRIYADCLAGLASHHLDFDAIPEAEALLRRVLGLPSPPVDRNVAGVCRAELGYARALRGDVAAGEAQIREAEEIMAREEDGPGRQEVIVSLPAVLAMGGKYREALKEADRVEQALRKLPRHADIYPQQYFRVLCARFRALNALREVGAEDVAERALEVARQAGYTEDDPAPAIRRAVRELDEFRRG